MRALASQRSARSKFTLPSDSDYDAIPSDGDLDPGSAQERIASIIPLIVSKINCFCRSMKMRELSQFEVTDLLQEIWIALLDKDRKYFDPDRGVKYITWATPIVEQQLGMLRNRCHTIELPRDAAQRLRDPVAASSKTADKIRAVMSGACAVNNEIADTGSDRVTEEAVAGDEAAKATRILRKAMARIPLSESGLLIRKYGLFGREPKPISVHEARLASEAEMSLAAAIQDCSMESNAYTSDGTYIESTY